MSTSIKIRVLGASVMMVLFFAGFWWKGPVEPGEAIESRMELTRDQLEMRDGLLHLPESKKTFTGLLVEYYPGKQLKVALDINDGKIHGQSRGWYRSGQCEVEEQFVDGVPHGKRTRWYQNGIKRSEAQLKNGQVVGRFVSWHDNGRKAAEATLVGGIPEGISRGWYRSGAPKSRVELQDGSVVSREDWPDTGKAEISARKQ